MGIKEYIGDLWNIASLKLSGNELELASQKIDIPDGIKGELEQLIYEFKHPRRRYSATSLHNDIKQAIEEKKATFSEEVLAYIDRKGMSDVDLYKKAGVSRQVFSNLRRRKNYKPKRGTAIAIALALELPYDEADKLLERAGYHLGHYSVESIICSYFFEHKMYDVFLLNETLLEFEANTLEKM